MLRRLIRFIRKYMFYGNNVECCICGGKFITFLPAGDDMKAHTRCPGCYSIDRNRQLWLTIKPLITKQDKTWRILHIAPEQAISEQLLKCKNVDYTAIDNFVSGLSYPSYVHKMDLTSLEFKDCTFDMILCSHVLEHITDDHSAMKEMHRVLTIDGAGYIMIPYFPELEKTFEDPSITNPEQRKILFGQSDHVRKYGRDFIKKLSAVHFDVEVLSIENSYNNEQKIRMGLMHAERIFRVCRHA